MAVNNALKFIVREFAIGYFSSPNPIYQYFYAPHPAVQFAAVVTAGVIVASKLPTARSATAVGNMDDIPYCAMKASEELPEQINDECGWSE